MKPIPTNDTLFVEEIKHEKQGLIELPDSAVFKSMIGTVISKGPGLLVESKSDGWTRIPVEFEIGETIEFYRHHRNVHIDKDGNEYLSVKARDVICKWV